MVRRISESLEREMLTEKTTTRETSSSRPAAIMPKPAIRVSRGAHSLQAGDRTEPRPPAGRPDSLNSWRPEPHVRGLAAELLG
jgi:hypothetical protein